LKPLFISKQNRWRFSLSVLFFIFPFFYVFFTDSLLLKTKYLTNVKTLTQKTAADKQFIFSFDVSVTSPETSARIFSTPAGSIDVGFFSAVYKKDKFSKEISLPYAKNEFKIIQYGDFLFVYINKKLEVYFFGYKTYGQESFLIGSNDDSVRVENVKILSRYANGLFLFAFYVVFCLFAFVAFFLKSFTSCIKAAALYFPLSSLVYLNFSPDMGAVPFFPVYVMGCLTAFLRPAASFFIRRWTFCVLFFGMLAVKDIGLKYDSGYFFMPSSVGEKIFFVLFLWGGMRYIAATLSLKNAKYVFAEQSVCLCVTAVIFYMSRYFFQMPFLQIMQVVKTYSGGMDPDWLGAAPVKYLCGAIGISAVFTLTARFLAQKTKNLYPFLFFRLLCLAMAIAALQYADNQFRMTDVFHTNKNERSNFILQNCIALKDVEIVSPKRPKNLILLYLESMNEKYAMSGWANQLKKLQEKHQKAHFRQIKQAGWTMSALATGWYAFPAVYADDEYLETLPLFLKNRGYRLLFVQSGALRFSATGKFLLQNGFEKEQTFGFENMPADKESYLTDSAGYARSDADTYSFFKKRLSFLAENTTSPFLAVMMTLDTHFRHQGNTEPLSERVKRASVLAQDFVDWVERQPFGKDTVVVIVGDHLSDAADWSKNNGIYNVFINALPRFPRDRIISHLDLFPTILEAAGYQIKGGRIRLGVSAFSGEKTIVEKLGIVNLSVFLEQTNFKKIAK